MNVITDAEWQKSLRFFRRKPNKISQKLSNLTERKKSSIILPMTITDYLPKPSDAAAKIAPYFTIYTRDLYAIGSNARKSLYNLSTTVTGYDFLISTRDETVVEMLYTDLLGDFPSTVRQHYGAPVLEIDCDAFDLTIRVEPVDVFLRSVRFAGDGMAMYVPDGRPIVLQEYMTLPPVTVIRETGAEDDQNKKEWVAKHINALNEFQSAMTQEMQKYLDGQTKRK